MRNSPTRWTPLRRVVAVETTTVAVASKNVALADAAIKSYDGTAVHAEGDFSSPDQSPVTVSPVFFQYFPGPFTAVHHYFVVSVRGTAQGMDDGDNDVETDQPQQNNRNSAHFFGPGRQHKIFDPIDFGRNRRIE